MNTLEEIANFLKTKGHKLVPMDNIEIINIETKLGRALPKVYKDFLRFMGKKAGDFLLGNSVFQSDLHLLREYAEELLAENDKPPLPKDAFVFWMHQGYQVAYFNLNEGDNPPVYFFQKANQVMNSI